MNIKQLRQVLDMTQKDFSQQYRIPLKTLQNWEADINSKSARECPDYIALLLEKAVKTDFPNVKNLIETDIDSKHVDAIIYAKSRIKKSKLSEYIKDVYLYGSTARGNAKSSSDVDILLILNDKVKDNKHINDLITYLKGNISSDDYNTPEVDLHVVFNENWKNNENAYFLNIKKEGFSIWS